MTFTTFRPFTEGRFWAVGCKPAKLAHRVVGAWPGNDAYQTACGASIVLHGEHSRWPDGGQSFEFHEIPARYQLCVKCVARDETVE